MSCILFRLQFVAGVFLVRLVSLILFRFLFHVLGTRRRFYRAFVETGSLRVNNHCQLKRGHLTQNGNS